MQTISGKILSRMKKHGKGWVFTPKDLLDIGQRRAIDTNLHRLHRNGKIRQVYRGIYDCPRFSDILKKDVPPDIDQVAQAFARKHGWRMQATGAMAANLLGLSTQVPAKVVYIIDGPSKSVKIGKTTVWFKKAAPKDLNVENPKSALVIQALKFIGKKSTNKQVLSKIRKSLSSSDKKKLLSDARFGTDWVYEAVRTICNGGDE